MLQNKNNQQKNKSIREEQHCLKLLGDKSYSTEVIMRISNDQTNKKLKNV
jgi:hypothetical protein